MLKEVEYYSEMIPTYISILAFATIFMEWGILGLLKKIKSHKEGGVSVLSAIITFFPLFVINSFITFTVMFWLYQYRVFDIGFEWYYWVLAVIAYDFMCYFIHFISHKVRILWCIHSVHHSSKEMKASAGARVSIFEWFLSPHLMLWLPLCGFHPFMIVIVEGLSQAYGIFTHMHQKSLPSIRFATVLEYLFISLSLHLVHHAKNDIYIDTNFGQTFSFWDRLFKTYQSEIAVEKPILVLVKEMNSENLLQTQTSEFVALWRDLKSTNNIIYQIKYLLMPPGWSHTDVSQTAHYVRKKALLNRAE